MREEPKAVFCSGGEPWTELLLHRRETTAPSQDAEAFFQGKTVLITGGAGSIGSQLCRFLLTLPVAQVIALDINENDLYLLERELAQFQEEGRFCPCLASVRDPVALRWILRRHSPQIVYHCAAHKHVPSMERFPCEGIKNNVMGTWHLANACVEQGVSCFMLVSTDKAVNPTSVMGATKAVAERIVGAISQQQSKTRMCGVRFGNVLGSKGSVLPLLQRQIAQGGPVLLTHPQMYRYFMTVQEAVMLIAQATAMEGDGDLFTLDMGEQISMERFACDLIRLQGLQPYREIAIRYTGIRPGEKLQEELVWGQEQQNPTPHPHIFQTSWERSHIEELFSAVGILAERASRQEEQGCIQGLWQILAQPQAEAKKCAKA